MKIIIYLIIGMFIFDGCAFGKTKNPDRSIEVKKHFELGEQQLKDTKYNEAISSFQKAITLDKKYINAYENLGWAYFAILDLDKACAQWEKALDLNPNSIQANMGIGFFHFMSHEYATAMKSFEVALNSDPDSPILKSTIHRAIGRVYYKEGLLDKAISEFEKTVNLNPDDAMAYWYLNKIYKEKGMKKEAEEYQNKFISTLETVRKQKKLVPLSE